MINKTQEKIQHQFLFLSPCKTNQPQLQCSNQFPSEALQGNLLQLLFLLFISKCLWISDPLQGPAPGQGQQRQCKSVPCQVPTGSSFPWSRRRGQFDVHRKKKKLLLIPAGGGVGTGSSVLNRAHHSQPRVRSIPTTDERSGKQTNSNL